MDENTLKHIIEEILKSLERKQALPQAKPKPVLYVLFPEKWDNKCYVLIDMLQENTEYDYDAIIYDDMSSEDIRKIVESSCFKNIHKISHIIEHSIEMEYLLIAKMPRNNVIRLAQCLCYDELDTLIKRQFENGMQIFLFSKGIEKLSGKEPETYSQKVLQYYKEMFEYGITLFDAQGGKH